MSGYDRLHSAFAKMIRSTVGSPIVIGKVISVDSVNYTCDVQPVDGSPVYHDIRLKSAIDSNNAGIVIIPKVDASIICVRLLEDSAMMIACSDIDTYLIKTDSGTSIEISASGEIKLNGDTYNGIVKHAELKSALDALVQNMNTLQSATLAGFTALSAIDSGASSTAYNTAALLQPVVTNTLENPKVKHG